MLHVQPRSHREFHREQRLVGGRELVGEWGLVERRHVGEQRGVRRRELVWEQQRLVEGWKLVGERNEQQQLVGRLGRGRLRPGDWPGAPQFRGL